MLASIPFSTCVHSIGQLKYTSESNTGFCAEILAELYRLAGLVAKRQIQRHLLVQLLIDAYFLQQIRPHPHALHRVGQLRRHRTRLQRQAAGHRQQRHRDACRVEF